MLLWGRLLRFFCYVVVEFVYVSVASCLGGVGVASVFCFDLM